MSGVEKDQTWTVSYDTVFHSSITTVSQPNQCCRHKFPNTGAHRALEDAQSMIAIFTTTDLSVVLQSPTMRNTEYIISDWNRVHGTYRTWKEAQSHYGQRVTRAMAKCLEENQLNHVRLQEIYRSCSSSPLSFDYMLMVAGVKMRTWRELLWDHFTGQNSTEQNQSSHAWTVHLT